MTAAIFPFVVFFILGIFRIQQVIEKYESALHNNYEVKAKGAAGNITQLIAQLDTAVGVLSESFEISNALQRADNNVLFDIRYWNQIEKYIHEHSEAKFSHGICRECAKKHFPDLGLYGD